MVFSFIQLIVASRRLRERFADQAAIARPAVLEAIAAIREMSETARERAGLKPTVMTAEDFRKEEHGHLRTFRIRSSATDDIPIEDDEILGIPADGFITEALSSADGHEEADDADEGLFGDADDMSLED